MRKYPTYQENVDGDFYVEKDCCLLCGIPELIAPELFEFKEDEYCYVKKQPANSEELQKMIEVVGDSEVNCIRYCGKDSKIMGKIYMPDDVCDYHPDHKEREPYFKEKEEIIVKEESKLLKLFSKLFKH